MRLEDIRLGDRVVVKNQFCCCDLAGEVGTVIDVNPPGYQIGVEFDNEFLAGHSCNGKARNGHGRFGYADEVELYQLRVINPNEIAISFGSLRG